MLKEEKIVNWILTSDSSYIQKPHISRVKAKQLVKKLEEFVNCAWSKNYKNLKMVNSQHIDEEKVQLVTALKLVIFNSLIMNCIETHSAKFENPDSNLRK